jgi:hypothetical protein
VRRVAGIDAGSGGFSVKRSTRRSGSQSMMPNALAAASGTGRAATVTSARRWRWNSIIARTSMR